MTHVGAIVLVPFPYSDRLAEKRRPALVVAHPSIGEGPELFWLAMITTARRSAWIGDVPVPEIAEAGLQAPCVVRSAKLVSLESVRIVRTIGAVSSTTLDQVRANIRRELETGAR
jgi:mRNA-degrading endonuclease toxin of MazEF toxin-antitoxin module